MPKMKLRSVELCGTRSKDGSAWRWCPLPVVAVVMHRYGMSGACAECLPGWLAAGAGVVEAVRS